MRKKIIFVILMIPIISFLTCVSSKSWVYNSSRKAGYGPPISAKDTLVVLPFDDSRKNENFNGLMLYLIPFVPFGWATIETPESVMISGATALVMNHRPTDDYPKALAKELDSSELFKEAFFDTKRGDARYAVLGNIVSTKYHQKIFSYLMSIYGPMLWFIGAPSMHVKNELVVDYALVDIKNKKILFEKQYAANPSSEIGWIYSPPNTFNYSEMLKEINVQFIKDLITSFPEGIEKSAKKGPVNVEGKKPLINFSDLLRSKLR